MRKFLIVTKIMFVLCLFAISSQAQNLEIYCIDVDQGDATLVVTPNKNSVLIDCGLDSKAPAVREVIVNYAGLDSIDYFVCTHYDRDHYGGIDKLVGMGVGVRKKFYDRDSEDWIPDTKKEQDDYVQYKETAGEKRAWLKPGQKIPIGDDVEIECIVSNGRAKGEYGVIEYPPEENGYSIGLIISYNDFDFFVAGDLTKAVERKLVERGVLKDVDVYHVSHHGAETSSDSLFLETIKPEVCIISNGSYASYLHPRRETMERLESTSSVQDIYQTNKNINPSPKMKNVSDEFIGDLDPSGSEGTILLSVKGSIYTITFLDRTKSYEVQQ